MKSSARNMSGCSASRVLAREIAELVGADPDLAERARDPRQGRSRQRHGRRVPRAARGDGPLLCARSGGGRGGRQCDRRALQAAGAVGRRAARADCDLGGARREARHAGRLLGDRRKADRIKGPLRASPRRARRDPHRAGERLRCGSAADAVAAPIAVEEPSRQTR